MNQEEGLRFLSLYSTSLYILSDVLHCL